MAELLPDADRVQIDQSKITEYLLSHSHPDGWSKAKFFVSLGFSVEKWMLLSLALKSVAATNPVVDSVKSAYGTRYVVDGYIFTPSGRSPKIRTIWVLEAHATKVDNAPRLVTAYPI